MTMNNSFTNTMKENKLLYGGDYSPEQWLKHSDILEEDVRLFKKAHINCVTMGVFSWGAYEKSEGIYDFSWLKERIDTLYDNGIYTILATPSGAIPRWLSNKYPEVLRVDSYLHRNTPGYRHNFCYSSPVYREKISIINEKLAENFGNHQGLLGWHISNEFGGDCFCSLCTAKFRDFLSKRYDNDIEKLNDAWYTSFWSRQYSSFDEIDPPTERGEKHFQPLLLNWRRFETALVSEYAQCEIAAIRKGGSNKSVTTNFMYDFGGFDYSDFGKCFDMISWDNYPLWSKKEKILTAYDQNLQHDFMRSILQKPFLLMESALGGLTWVESRIKEPGLVELSSLSAIAHGSDSVQYFQLRQSQGATEQYLRGLIDHYGKEDTRMYQEAMKLGERLEQLSKVKGTKTISPALLIYDRQSVWALEMADLTRSDAGFDRALKKYYYGLKEARLNVDAASMETDFSGYSLIAAPMSYMYRCDFAKRIEEFVKNGGVFVTGYMSGLVDADSLCFLGGAPGNLTEVLGLRSEETDTLLDGQSNFVEMTVSLKDNNFFVEKYSCDTYCDLIKLTTAEPLAVYGDDFYKGSPAVTVNNYGRGRAYYIAADMQKEFYYDLFKYIVSQNDIPVVLSGKLPHGIEVSSRQSDEKEYIFIQNYSEQDLTIETEVYEGIIKRSDTIIIEKAHK